MKRFSSLLTLLALFLAGCSPASPTPTTVTSPQGAPVELTVAAAADLQFAFTEIGELYEQETGNKVIFSFGSTGQLAQQIENSAPFDLFAAANISFVDDLAKKKLVVLDTVALYARGRIVLAVNKDSGVNAVTLENLLSDKITHIAIANPEHAPYGVAAKEALISAGVWDKIEDKIVYGENVRQTLQFIQTGDAQVGIVALSVANVPEVTWSLIDDTLHNPLNQALAVVSSSSHQEEAKEFAAFINGEKGRPIMQKYGFVLPSEPISTRTP